ncbi:hypothetical protein [Mycoplasma hafezii]|uniref:hypothetical protein n=1 Tax=Mycoplasma hafezii TaxID=525886 RepID=UPI003CEAF065
MTDLISMTGTSPKKGKGSTRARKKREITKEKYNKLSSDDLIEIIEYLRDIVKNTSTVNRLNKNITDWLTLIYLKEYEVSF